MKKNTSNVKQDLPAKSLAQAGVTVKLNQRVKVSDLAGYDFIINSTYADLNSTFGSGNDLYQFELCEKPVLKLPPEFKDVSLVVADGPFMCVDPYSDTGYHVMGNVVHAIHHSNTGLDPEIPEPFRLLLNKGIIANPPITNVDKFITAAVPFMPQVAAAKHIGSMYTFRTVFPNVDKTDERPTEVTLVDDRLVKVFSGKIGTCVKAAERVCELIGLC